MKLEKKEKTHIIKEDESQTFIFFVSLRVFVSFILSLSFSFLVSRSQSACRSQSLCIIVILTTMIQERIQKI